MADATTRLFEHLPDLPDSPLSSKHLSSEEDSTSSSSAPSNMAPNNTNFTVGTLSFDVDVTNPIENTISQVGLLYSKESRPTVGSQEEKDLITAITSKQYDKYKMISTSVKDIENLKNNLSVTKRLHMTYDCWERYDLLDPCNILFPISNQSAELHLEDDGKGNKVAKFRDLFKHHRKITVQEVAASCRYYQLYVTFKDKSNVACTFAKEMAWSYNHFRKNVDDDLFESVNAEFRLFDKAEQGGPLFLKLLLDQLVISNEDQLAELVHTTTTYDIKTMNEGENITEVIKLLSSITDTIVALRDNSEDPLPERYIYKMVKVFQTTSVSSFNDTFKALEDDLKYSRLYNRTAQATALTARGTLFHSSTATSGYKLDNSNESAIFLWAFAREAYRMSIESGEWNSATKTKEGSSFAANQRPFSSVPRNCWNCNKPGHIFTQCRLPYDADKVNANRIKFRNAIAQELQDKEDATSQSGSSSGRRNRGNGRSGPPYKFRPPEPNEHNKRVIDGCPHTYNPSTRHWAKDQTPDSGIDNSMTDDRTAPTAEGTTAHPSGLNVSTGDRLDSDTASVMTEVTTPQDVARLQLQLAHIQQQLSGVTIS